MNTSSEKWSKKHPGSLLLTGLILLSMMATTAVAAVFPITITANNSSKVYGTPITFVTANTPTPSPDYTVTGSLQAGDTVDAVTLTSAGTAAAAPVSGSPYIIVPSAAVMTITSGNTYTISYVNGSMTVTPRGATLIDPAFRKPILLAESQAASAWTNVIPNALADYYTFVPFKNADAVALGFPASCGNPTAVGATAADLASTDDCYSISAKKFQQEMSLPAAWGFGGNGLIDPATGIPFGPTTWAFGYGSGGSNWILPYYDTSKPGVVANTPVTGNAPAPFSNGTLASTGIWHWPAPSIKGTKGRPVRVQWLNELPNEHFNGFDPTLCGGLPADCFPYNRIVVHVHGAHTGPENDGQVHGWFTPGFSQVGSLWETTRQHGPEGTYLFPMDQEAGTIWYHDHATGTTHTSVNMGLAGFFPITDANEKLLQTNNILPTGSRELGFALQDRVFYDDSQMTMSDAPILDPLFAATCVYTTDPISGDMLVTSAPGSCSPIFMKDPVDGHLIPYPAVPGAPAPPAYLAVSSTLEFFGKMPVVNGVTYGKYNVSNLVHRVRFLNGSDSRTWALRLKVAGSNPARYLPFWQIAAEQGLFNNPVKTENLLIMPGERVDVLVDFSGREVLDAGGVPAGPLNLVGARIIVENWAGDLPYGGQAILPASNPLAMDARSVEIPEVMAFDVTAGAAETILPPSAATSLRPGVPAVPNLTLTPPPAGTPVRTVSLVEIVDLWQRIMPTLDGRGFMGFGVSELPKLNSTEVWEIVNTTVDAHPIHLHQVAFQLINRETIASTCPTSPMAPLCVTPASTATAPYTPAVVTAYQPGSIVAPLPEEIGYKDTIICPPGKVTRVIATFDIPGTYVWHCHILSHEEHDMMRPMIITTPAASVTLTASNSSQPTGAVMTPVTLTAQAVTGIAAYPLGRGFEYDFTVTGPAHAPLPAPPQPTRSLPPFNSSMGDAFNVVNLANWTPPTNPGVYTITASTKAMGAVGAGNPLVTTTMNYIVGNATVTINPASLTATYNGLSKAVTIQSTTPPGLPLSITYNGSATPPTNAGNYNVVVTIVDPTNTYFGTTSATMVINRVPITVKANNASRTYGAANPANPGFTITSGALVPGENISAVTYTYQATATATAPAASTHTITPGAALFGTGSAANYTISYASGVLTITKAPLSIRANDQVKPYGTLLSFAGSEFTPTGLLNSDTITSVSFSSNGAAASATVAGSPYTIRPFGAAGTGLTNYTITFVNGVLTVAKATPVITWATPAAVTYGSTLTGTPFNATANVAGTFAYSPAVGTLLNTSSTTLSATFTPTDTANYASIVASVNQATIPGTTAVAKISTGPAYPSIQTAYNAVLSGDVIKLLGTTLPGPLLINNPLVSVITISGGYDATFAPIPGSTTTIQGKVTLQQGKVIMNGIRIR